MSDEKRLIEDYPPIEKISAEASRGKSVRKGHISTLTYGGSNSILLKVSIATNSKMVS
jgi:hypothetical protein